MSAPVATSDNPLDPVAPLAAQSLDRLKGALKTAGSESADVVRVTCFLSSLENLAATRKLVEADYPRAALNYVQTQRSPSRALAACEAVARLTWNTGTRVFFQPAEASPSPHWSPRSISCLPAPRSAMGIRRPIRALLSAVCRKSSNLQVYPAATSSSLTTTR